MFRLCWNLRRTYVDLRLRLATQGWSGFVGNLVSREGFAETTANESTAIEISPYPRATFDRTTPLCK
jgi:hypothetical protein